MLDLAPTSQLVLVLTPLGGIEEGRASVTLDPNATITAGGTVWVDPDSFAEASVERRDAVAELLAVGISAARDAMNAHLEASV